MGQPAEKIIAVNRSIPDDLRRFFEYVWYGGIVGHEDWAETVSDDMIQAPNIAPVTGGLCDKKAKRFFFSYRPRETAPEYWSIYLFDNEIEDIAKGHTSTLTLWKCEHETCHDLHIYRTSARCCKPRVDP